MTTEPLYVDVHIDHDGEVTIPTPVGHNAFVYVYEGGVSIVSDRSQTISRGEIALLGAGDQLTVTADEKSRFITVAGRPLNEPIARYGPFVMNTEDEIRQALLDRQAGLF